MARERAGIKETRGARGGEQSRERRGERKSWKLYDYLAAVAASYGGSSPALTGLYLSGREIRFAGKIRSYAIIALVCPATISIDFHESRIRRDAERLTEMRILVYARFSCSED